MRVISRKTLREFWIRHADSEQALKAWFFEVQSAKWTSPSTIKTFYPTASILSDNRVVFRIRGNAYRIIVKVNYDYGLIYIRFVGTHAEYDKIDAFRI